MYENSPRDSGLDKDSNPSPKRRLVSTNCHRSMIENWQRANRPFSFQFQHRPEDGYCRRLGGNLVSPPISPKAVSLVTDLGTWERKPRERPLLHIQGGYSDSRASLKTWNGFPQSQARAHVSQISRQQPTGGCPPLSWCTQSEVPRCLSWGDGYLKNISQPISK